MKVESTRSNQSAWDITARKYRSDVASDVALLRSGAVSLFPIEVEMLGNLSTCSCVVHLQCSHGLDTLSLLNLGANRVIGIDISSEMLKLAREKSEAIGANAEWIMSDVLDLPAWCSELADLVYTGKGALPWVFDLDRWAIGIMKLLKPGARLVLMEGHPLNWVWKLGSETHELSADRGGYFDSSFRVNLDFPAEAVDRLMDPGSVKPQARERQWNIGQVVSALARSGLVIDHLDELSQHFWPQFREIPEGEIKLLPHSFVLEAHKPNV